MVDIPPDRIRTCIASLVFENEMPEDVALDCLLNAVAREIAVKLVEFKKYAVKAESEGGKSYSVSVDVIVPPRPHARRA